MPYDSFTFAKTEQHSQYVQCRRTEKNKNKQKNSFIKGSHKQKDFIWSMAAFHF